MEAAREAEEKKNSVKPSKTVETPSNINFEPTSAIWRRRQQETSFNYGFNYHRSNTEAGWADAREKKKRNKIEKREDANRQTKKKQPAPQIDSIRRRFGRREKKTKKNKKKHKKEKKETDC